MSQAELVDIAIGVVFTFFALSLIVSAIHEAIVRVLGVRSKQLWRALRRMLDDSLADKKENRSGLWGNMRQAATYKRRPTGTPDDGKVTDSFYASSSVQAMEVRTDPTRATRIHHIPAPVFAQGMLETIAGWGDEAMPVAGDAVHAYETTAKAIDDFIADPKVPEALRRQVRVLWGAANCDIKKFCDGLGTWFDSQMSRLSSIYKTQTRIILGVVGLFVVLAGFAFGQRTDSLALLTDLQHDQNLRSVLSSTAGSAVQGDLASLGCKQEATDGSTTTTAPTAECQLKGLIKLKAFDLSLRSGPKAAESAYAPASDAKPLDRLRFLSRHIRALLGVLLTTVAIAFGSSFWYSILQRLVGIRGKGDTPRA